MESSTRHILTGALLVALLGAAPGRTASAAGGLALEARVSPGWEIEPFSPPVSFRITGDGPWSRSADPRALSGVDRWQIQIFDFDDRKVDYFQGLGPPARKVFHWDGVARSGRLLRDGFYTARLVWADLSGGLHKTEPVQVSLFLPRGLRDFLGADVRCVYGEDGLVIRVAEVLAFAPGEWRLRPQALPVLQGVARFLLAHPGHRLVVQGHADVTGGEAVNLQVSLGRARAVYRFLAERGVGPERMAYEGLGASQPVADNATEEGRRRNRRVDIVVRKAAI